MQSWRPRAAADLSSPAVVVVAAPSRLVGRWRLIRVRLQIIRHARTHSVGKYQSCMFLRAVPLLQLEVEQQAPVAQGQQAWTRSTPRHFSQRRRIGPSRGHRWLRGSLLGSLASAQCRVAMSSSHLMAREWCHSASRWQARYARILNVGKYQSCMVSKLPLHRVARLAKGRREHISCSAVRVAVGSQR